MKNIINIQFQQIFCPLGTRTNRTRMHTQQTGQYHTSENFVDDNTAEAHPGDHLEQHPSSISTTFIPIPQEGLRFPAGTGPGDTLGLR